MNILVFILLFLSLEIAARGFHVVANNGSFFRDGKFISPWITSYDYPPPIVRQDGNAYFRHRTNPTPIEKPDNLIRLVAVGGSTTANEIPYASSGVDYSTSLESLLQTDNTSEMFFEVLNAGGDAYSTAQSLINIQFRLVEFKPDIILLMHNINDSSVNAFNGGATSDYSNKYLQPYYLNPELQGSLSFFGFLWQSRLLTKFGVPALFADRSGDIDVNNDYGYGLELFKRNLITIAQFAKSNDIDLVLLTQPITFVENQYIRSDVFMEYNKAIAEVSSNQGVGFVDMFTKFGHAKRYFVDEFHYSPAGIDRFSLILHSELNDLISRRTEKRRLEQHDARSMRNQLAIQMDL